MRHVFIVGCGFPQLGLIRAARAHGFELTGADLNPQAIGVPLVHHFLPASTGDADAIVEAFRRSGARGIATSGSELALTTTALAAHRLGLPFYATPETVHRCQAKDAMRAGYSAAGLPIPRFEACSEVQRARQFVARVGLPVVIKPAHGWGQRGVARDGPRGVPGPLAARGDAQRDSPMLAGFGGGGACGGRGAARGAGARADARAVLLAGSGHGRPCRAV
jgi:biotin carboxylase